MKPGFILVLTVTALLILCSCTSCDRRDTQAKEQRRGLSEQRSCVSLPPRPHGVPRQLYGQAGFHNGSVSRDPVPVRQTVMRRRSRPGHLRLRRSHFAMSSISPKFIPLIIKDIRFSNLLDPAYSATKRPFSPISSQVQQIHFPRASDYQAFL